MLPSSRTSAVAVAAKQFLVMMAIIGVSVRRGAIAATAFSISSSSASSSLASAAGRGFFQRSAKRNAGWRTPFGGGVRTIVEDRRGSLSSIRMSSTAEAVATMSVADLEKTLEVTHPAFDVVERDVVNEYGAYCTLYRHKKSGAELLSVSNDDDNKVFGITFRTPPEDSTGVPHILEHSVLCGSRKYTTKVRVARGGYISMYRTLMMTLYLQFSPPTSQSRRIRSCTC